MYYVVNLNEPTRVRANFLGNNGGTGTDPVVIPTDTVTFLHISDIHEALSETGNDSLSWCKRMMDDPNENIAFTIYTGDSDMDDTKVFDIDTNPLGQSLLNFNTDTRDLLVINGNHDIWGGVTGANVAAANINTSTAATEKLYKIMGNKVNWGGKLRANNTKRTWSYWYKDYTIEVEGKSSILRIIGIDSYQCYRLSTSASTDGYVKHNVVYYSYEDIERSSGDDIPVGNQIAWFADRIKDLGPNDYLLVALHEPPVAANHLTSNDTPIDYWKGTYTEGDNEGKIKNSFYSDNLINWGTAVNNGDIWPMIIHAYQNKERVTFEVSNKNSGSTEATNCINVVGDEDFTNSTPCTFLGYLCGHKHADICCEHPKLEYNNQLIMCVDCSSDSSKALGNSDILYKYRVGHPVLINKVTIDFSNKRIKIERFGNNQFTGANGSTSIGTRKSITFNFNAQIVAQEYGEPEDK